MFGQYGFVLPSGAPPTAESLAREAADREAKLQAAAAAKVAAAAAQRAAAEAAAAPPKLKQLTPKQAAALSKVEKLNAAQVAKLDAKELEAYRAARAEEKKLIKQARRELNTPEERAAAKAEARRLRKEQAKEIAKKAKEQAAAKEQAELAAAEAAAAATPKLPKAPKVVEPVVPSSSAATNPALRSEGLKKKDESVRAAERAERKRQRRIAMGLPPEEESAPSSDPSTSIDATTVTPAESILTSDQIADAESHRNKLDAMRNARMQAVQEREDRDPLRQAMKGAKDERAKSTSAPTTTATTPSSSPSDSPSITVVSTAAPAAAPNASEVTAAMQAKPLWMVRGRQISPHSSVAVEDFSLDERIKGVLKRMNITRFFAAQSELLPVILKSYGTNDICCCAPTGSGKTLAYLLPLVQSLCTRIVTRLRALILVPSRDLALQVLKVLQPFAAVTGLKVDCILGQSSFEAEKARLVRVDELTGKSESLVDLLICTPGRLMDHLAAADTSLGQPDQYGFHLRDLQYLVIDEIDRLLTQNYQDWPSKILGHIFDSVGADAGKLTVGGDRVVISENHLRRKQARGGGVDEQAGGRHHLPLQKLLFSATLTNNPQKLATLQLSNPLFFTESTSDRKKFQIPVNLKQWIINLKDTAQKPIVLIHLLQYLQRQSGKVTQRPDAITEAGVLTAPTHKQILIFTSSIESTHRLYRLLELYEGGAAFEGIAEFSSALAQKDRNKIIKRFGRGECKMYVCKQITILE